jgi:hypothetical protein
MTITFATYQISRAPYKFTKIPLFAIKVGVLMFRISKTACL